MKMIVTVIAKSKNYVIVEVDKLSFGFSKNELREDMELNKKYEIDLPEEKYDEALLQHYFL